MVGEFHSTAPQWTPGSWRVFSFFFFIAVVVSLLQDAKELLVNYYSQLRERDSQISNKYASRITVRQLESMIRLSEAMAKMECSDEVRISS